MKNLVSAIAHGLNTRGVTAALLLPVGALGLASIASPYFGNAVARVSTSGTSFSQRMRTVDSNTVYNCLRVTPQLGDHSRLIPAHKMT